MRHDNNAGAARVLENVVRTIDPVKLPPDALHISNQVGASHRCVWYTLITIRANMLLLRWGALRYHHPQVSWRGFGVEFNPCPLKNPRLYALMVYP